MRPVGLLALLWAVVIAHSWAQPTPNPPGQLSYQGFLTDANGIALATNTPKNYDVSFRIYNAPSGGAALWGEIQTVTIDRGYFSVLLGQGAALSGGEPWTNNLAGIFSGSDASDRYIGMTVKGITTPDSEIQPRLRLLASPYAFLASKANNAVALAGYDWSTVFPDTGNPSTGTIPGTKITPNTIGTAQITNGAITPAKLNLQGANVAIGQPTASYPLDVEGTNSFAFHSYNSHGTYVFLTDGSYGIYAGGNMQLYGNANINGNLTVSGSVTKNSGSFRIDHPLDPANKYLYHSFVESPDMKNMYDGLAVLDKDGEALVPLPDWFEALNQDFRYQLTAVGGPGPNLYIAQEVSHNQFKIAGGTAGMKVSWQVTGVRHDAYANAHRIPVEVEKPAELRGHYEDPAELGQPDGALESAELQSAAAGRQP